MPILVLNLLTSIPAQAAYSCFSLNVPTLADNSMTVTMLSMVVDEKPGSYRLTISYKLLNETADKKIDEGSFKLFFADGSVDYQYGIFGTLFPTDLRERSYTWEYLKAKAPIAVSYNAEFLIDRLDASKLNWALPGQVCNFVSPESKVAADKAAADKVAADKVAIDKAIADQAIVEKAAADKAIADSLRKNQTIAVSPIVKGSVQYSQTRIAVKVASTSNLAVFAYNNTSSICEYRNSSILMKSTGRCVIAFSQEGDSEFKPATNVIIDFKIASGSGAAKSTTISCVKEKLIKKVTAVIPKCPTGYKVKK